MSDMNDMTAAETALAVTDEQQKQMDNLLLAAVKHPFIWSGVGTLIRYAGDDSEKAAFWKRVGLMSLLLGVSHVTYQQVFARFEEIE